MGISSSSPRIPYKPEGIVNGGVPRLNTKQLGEIIFQMENCVCKIKNKKIGTGFFCKIPFPDNFKFLPVLITCNHVLDENSIAQGNEIEFTLNNDKIAKSIVINNSRMLYTNIKKDITIIEIKPKGDSIDQKSFLEIDKKIYEANLEKYIEKPVYLNHYQEGKEVNYSLGKIIKVGGYNIKHNCETDEGSSGSPILNLENFSVVGVHKGFDDKFNCGTFIKIAIEEFNELHKNSEGKKQSNEPITNKNSEGKKQSSEPIQSNEPITNKNSEGKKQSSEPIIKKIFSYQTESGNFYVSNIELLKINYKFSAL